MIGRLRDEVILDCREASQIAVSKMLENKQCGQSNRDGQYPHDGHANFCTLRQTHGWHGLLEDQLTALRFCPHRSARFQVLGRHFPPTASRFRNPSTSGAPSGTVALSVERMNRRIQPRTPALSANYD